MRDQEHCGIAPARDVAGREFRLQPLIGSVAELFHNLTRLCAVLRNIGIVAGQCLEHVLRHSPDTFRRRQHDPTNVALAVGNDVDEGLAVEAQCHCPPQIGVVERRLGRVDDHRPVDVCGRHLTDRLRGLHCEILQSGDRYTVRRVDVEFAGKESEVSRRDFSHDRIFDPVEIWPSGFPIVGIADQLDRLVRLEADKFERTRADRMLPHLARRNMARIDRRPSRSQ